MKKRLHLQLNLMSNYINNGKDIYEVIFYVLKFNLR